MSDAIFFYGTLRPALVAEPLRQLILGLEPLGDACMPGRLFDLGPYPAAILDESSGTIRGEVFTLPNEPTLLTRLDEHEDYRPHDPQGSAYLRVLRRATLADGRRLDVWVYAYNRPVDRAIPVPDGDYVTWRMARQHLA